MKAFLFLLTLLISCSDTARFDPTIQPVLVRGYADGRITLNHTSIEAADLPSAMLQIKKDGGGIWFWTEDSDEPPYSNYSVIMTAAMESRVPVSLSKNEDFSDEFIPGRPSNPRWGYAGNPTKQSEIHHRDLETVLALMAYGYGAGYYQPPAKWKRTNAPHARTEIDGGCTIGFPYLLTQACPICNELEQEWRRNLRAKDKS
jgi:hypothetical protein